MNELKETIYNDIQLATRYCKTKLQSFSVLDFGIFKMSLIFFGAFLATVFSKTAQKLKGIFFIGTLLTFGYLIWRMFFADDTI